MTITAQVPGLELAGWQGEARNEHGEWIELYHGTKITDPDVIRRTGLTAERYSPYNAVLTKRKDEAGYFAGAHGAVVTVRIPSDKADEYLNRSSQGLASLKKPLPAQMIHSVEAIGMSGITVQALDLAATAAVDPAALGQPGIPVPDDTTAVPMFVAHRLDDTLRSLAHATERSRAAQGAAGDLRAYHCAHLTRHLAQTLDNLHGLTACIREHFPAEAAELEQVRRDVGLAKALSPQAKAATTAHLLETTLHETAHAERHAAVMGGPGGPGDVWAFNAEHCAKHLAGAVEHAGKLAEQFTDNYPPVARWLTELDTIAAPPPDDGGGRQHARYSGTKLAGTISGQIDLRNWEGWRDEPRNDHGQWTRGAAGVLEKVTEPIRGEGARGNSRPVSEDEFHQLAAEGRDRLNDIQHQPWTTEGIRKNWDAIKARTYAEVQNSWGGATIDPRSGHDLPQGADKYAMSIKPTGLDTTSIPEHASRADFDEAMNIALAKYGKQLGKGGSYLGVFHDDDLNRIDIDPVTVLDTLREVETIGAYTHAIGGAYHFASGDGFWPPHVPENAAAMSNPVGSGHHFRGPGHWHSQAVAVQQPHNEPEDTQPDDEDTEPPPDGIAAQATDLAWSAATRARAHAKAHATAAATARAHERRDARGRFAKGNDLLGSPLDDARMLGRSPGQRPIGNVTRANAERQRLAAQGHGPETIQQQMMREAGELNTLGSQLRAAGYVPPPVPPPPPSPGAQFVARHLRAQGHGPETIREKLRSRALRKAAQPPSPAAAAAEVERVRAEGKAALRARQHAARRAAGDTWTVDEQGNIVHGAHPGSSPSPSGDVLAPGVKQLTFPGMPHPPAHAATITEVTRRLDSAIAADHASLKQPGEDAQVDVPSYEGNYFGNTADTKIITFADGSRWVRKRGLPQDEMNAEVAYGLVSGVFGSGSPQPVIRRDSDGETAEWQPALDNAETAIEWAGQDPDWEDYDPDTATGDPEEMYNSAAGRLIGIVDTVTSASDRHMGNWMVTTQPDGTKRPVAIDNGRAAFQGGTDSPFAGYLDPGELADEYPTAQWDQWQRGLEAIVPELDDMDIDTPGMMQAFDDLRLEVGA